MANLVEIYNLALSNIAAKAFITSPTEDSNERKYCSANINNALETVLEDHDWGFASFNVALAELKRSSDIIPPPSPWLFEYQYPSQCVKAREIVKVSDNEVVVPFKVGLNDTKTGKVILTDKEDAILRFTFRITNLTLLTPRAVEAVAWKLSTKIAIPLTINLKLKQNAEASYLNSIAAAKASDFNEGVNREPADPTQISARS